MSQKCLHQGRKHIWQGVVLCWIITVVNILINQANADITTDGTVGPAANLTGPDYEIGAHLGTNHGANLFHSFTAFALDTGESATFTGPDNIENVISRVTGGEASRIDGLLRSEVGTADFYFINPAGVMFGPNAQVDVPAAFHVSTADELQFQDGAVFNAANPESSALSMAQPESFGFLSPQPASLTVNGSQLVFTPASELSMVAGSVTVEDEASLTNSGGSIHITSVGETETMVDIVSGATDSVAGGNISIRESSSLTTSGSAGTQLVELRGGAVEIEGSTIEADNLGAEDSGGHILLEGESVRVVNSDVRARVYGSGRGNDIQVVASDLEIDAETANDGIARLMTKVTPGASGQAGDVHIEVERVSLLNGGQLSSVIDKGAVGSGGGVEIQATDAVTIEGSNDEERYSGIYTTSRSEEDADGGSILIEAPEAQVTITQGGTLQTGTVGAGDAGSVTIDANNLLILDDSAINSGTVGLGDAGLIALSASVIELRQSYLDARTNGSGKAGNINLETSDALLITNNSAINASSYRPPIDSRYGDAGKVLIEAGSLLMEESDINVFSASRANAGTIEVIADEIHVDNTSGDTITGFFANNYGGSLLTPGSDLNTSEEGQSGTITLDATNITFDHGAKISIDTSAGDGGSLIINAEELSLLNGSKLTAITTGLGHGGGVQIDVSGFFLIEEGLHENGITSHGGILTSTSDINTHETGAAGAINIDAGTLIVGRDGQIQSSSSSNVPSGQITLNVGSLEVRDGGEVFAGALSQGPGADIVIIAQDAIRVYGVDPRMRGDPSEINVNASFLAGGGNAGSILIEAPLLMLERGGRLVAENSANGVGGAITLSVGELVIQSGGEISTSSFGEGGVAGSIQIDANYVSINQEGSETLNPLLQQTGLFSGSFVFTDSVNARGAAGTISVKARDMIELHSGAKIATNAIEENGGSITIDGGILLIDDSLITTSVEGEQGNGGDITLSPEMLVLNGGFIQANTAAPEASGGNILVDTKALIASDGSVQVGGAERVTFQAGDGINVIQAAAPDGVQGGITIMAPELDISGALTNLTTAFLEPTQLMSNPCAALTGEEASKLVQGGRGGVPEGPKDPGAVSFGGDRLDRLLSPPFAGAEKVGGSAINPTDEEPGVVIDQIGRCLLGETL